MSLFFGPPRQKRTQISFSNPPIPPNSQAMFASDVASPAGAEWSLQKVAMWSAVDLITSLISELPLDIYSGVKRDRKQLPTPSHLENPGGDQYGTEDWISQLLMSWLLRGNANGEVIEWGRDRQSTYPAQINLYHPDTVAGWYRPDGTPEWRVSNLTKEPANMWHRRVHTVPGILMGLSPVAYQASTIGLALSAQQFGLQWFRDGAHPSGMLTNSDMDLKGPDTIRKVKDAFLAAVFGTREPLVLGKGWKYEAIQINPEESQFLETNEYSSAECARLFGPGVAEVLGYKSGDGLTYTTLEGRTQHLLVFALGKWIRRVERVLTSMLPTGQYAKLNTAALLQTTTLERFRIHEIALRNRIRPVNEVRDDEDWGPVPWGDEPNPISSGATPPTDGKDDGGQLK